jgi:hypothetical protein
MSERFPVDLEKSVREVLEFSSSKKGLGKFLRIYGLGEMGEGELVFAFARHLCTRSSHARAKLELGQFVSTAHSIDVFLETGTNCGWCTCLNLGSAQEVKPS